METETGKVKQFSLEQSPKLITHLEKKKVWAADFGDALADILKKVRKQQLKNM